MLRHPSLFEMQPSPTHSRTPRASRRGLSLLEVSVALTVLTVAVYMLSSTITSVLVHAEAKAERTLAVDAVMNQIEQMHSQPFDQLFVLYNDLPDDDPGGAGTAPGMHFVVPGLSPRADDQDGFVGRVRLPESAGQLREDVQDRELSMPRDLDGDLRIDDDDHAGDYLVLPATVEVEWQGKAGAGSLSMSTMFAKLEKVRR